MLICNASLQRHVNDIEIRKLYYGDISVMFEYVPVEKSMDIKHQQILQYVLGNFLVHLEDNNKGL